MEKDGEEQCSMKEKKMRLWKGGGKTQNWKWSYECEIREQKIYKENKIIH